MIKMWRPDLETSPRETLEKRQIELFKETMAYIIEKSPLYRRKYAEAGVKPGDIKRLEDIKKVPVTTTDELLKSQEKHPPYGDFKCILDEEAVRVFQTSGTTGTPLRIPRCYDRSRGRPEF